MYKTLTTLEKRELASTSSSDFRGNTKIQFVPSCVETRYDHFIQYYFYFVSKYCYTLNISVCFTFL